VNNPSSDILKPLYKINRRRRMSFLNKRLAVFTLLFSMALAPVLIGTDSSMAINNIVALYYHGKKLLPGTPPLKKGYEETEAIIRPVIEKHEPKIVPVSRDVLGAEI